MIISLDKYNYVCDKKTHEKLEIQKIDPLKDDWYLCVSMPDGSTLKVDSSEIKENYGGNRTFNYNDEVHIVNDSYQNQLVMAGYIVKNNYDSENISDKEAGESIREILKYDIKEAFTKTDLGDAICYDLEEINSTPSTIGVFEKYGFKFIVNINTVSGIVTKNKNRKLNNLSFYPFNKEMDKYGTMYLTIFAQKVSNIYDNETVSNKTKYDISDSLVKDLIVNLSKESNDKYHFVQMNLKRKLFYWNNL